MTERIFMVVVVSFLLLCVGIGVVVSVYLWLIWYISLHDRSNRGQRPSDGNDKPQKPQGLSAADLQQLPIIECLNEKEEEERSTGRGAEGNAECAVCLEVFQSGDRCRVIPACSHAFHVQCADAWLSKRSFCPICRRSAACESREKQGVNDGAAATLKEEEGQDEESRRSCAPPPAESIVVDVLQSTGVEAMATAPCGERDLGSQSVETDCAA